MHMHHTPYQLTEKADYVGMSESLHQLRLLHELLNHSRVLTGQCLHCHWDLALVASNVLWRVSRAIITVSTSYYHTLFTSTLYSAGYSTMQTKATTTYYAYN